MARAIGERYGRLVIAHIKTDAIHCRCDCGIDHTIRRASWGKIKSCGCGRRDWARNLNLAHGMTGTPTYVSWQAMTQRCTNPNAADYARYGGAGITIDPRWKSFRTFLANMGERPTGTTLDRIDGTKGYSPSNCRWATASQQNANKRHPLREKCQRGHLLTDDNVITDGSKRRCRTCREASRRR